MEAASGAKDPPKKMTDDGRRVHRRNSQPSEGSKEQKDEREFDVSSLAK